jgi:hypothetical protein
MSEEEINLLKKAILINEIVTDEENCTYTINLNKSCWKKKNINVYQQKMALVKQ